jgi:chemosensory pili system protein ChpA (sensor histidine kinase/response regulator)
VADDPEMREIFLEEADEVIANARAHWPSCASSRATMAS